MRGHLSDKVRILHILDAIAEVENTSRIFRWKRSSKILKSDTQLLNKLR